MGIIDKLRQLTGLVSFSDGQFILYGACMLLILVTIIFSIYILIKLKKD